MKVSQAYLDFEKNCTRMGSSGRSSKNQSLHNILNRELERIKLQRERPVGIGEGYYAGGLYLPEDMLYQLYIAGQYFDNCNRSYLNLGFDFVFGKGKYKGILSYPVSIEMIRNVAPSAESIDYEDKCSFDVCCPFGWEYNARTDLRLDYDTRKIAKIVVPEVIKVVKLFEEKFK